jgi:hypothetical protein
VRLGIVNAASRAHVHFIFFLRRSAALMRLPAKGAFPMRSQRSSLLVEMHPLQAMMRAANLYGSEFATPAAGSETQRCDCFQRQLSGSRLSLERAMGESLGF